MDLSVVVPAHDAAATLGEQLDALAAQEWDGEWEIVVVDDASTDGTAGVAAERARHNSRIRIVARERASGPSAARNAGAAAAAGRAIAFCDADDLVGPHWVAAMGRNLREHPCVTGPLEVRLLNPAWLVETRGTPDDVAPSTYYGVFPMLPSGNMGLRRDVWEALGGLDESMRAHEDTELSLRLWQRGVAVHFDPEALVHYRYRTDARSLFRQGRTYGAQRPALGKRLRRLGSRAPSRLAGWRSWLLLVAWLPRLRTRDGRAAWCWVAGNRLGHLEGSIRARSLFL